MRDKNAICRQIMSIRIKSVCLNQPSDSFLYISSFCPPLYSRSTPPKIFSLGRFVRLSSSKVRHITISVYTILSYILQDQVKCHICQKVNFFLLFGVSHLSLAQKLKRPLSPCFHTASAVFLLSCLNHAVRRLFRLKSTHHRNQISSGCLVSSRLYRH